MNRCWIARWASGVRFITVFDSNRAVVAWVRVDENTGLEIMSTFSVVTHRLTKKYLRHRVLVRISPKNKKKTSIGPKDIVSWCTYLQPPEDGTIPSDGDFPLEIYT